MKQRLLAGAGVAIAGLFLPAQHAAAKPALGLATASAHAYVAPAPLGSDRNSCRSPKRPCLSLQAAWAKLAKAVGEKTLHIADGTYTAGLKVVGSGDDHVAIVGNNINPAKVLLDIREGEAIRIENAKVTVNGMEFRTTDTAPQLLAAEGGEIDFSNVRFGLGGQHVTARRGGHVRASGNYDIVVGGLSHLHAARGGTIELRQGIVVTLHSVVFLAYFAGADYDGSIKIDPGVTFSGLASTAKFYVSEHGRIDSGGLGLEGLPGGFPGVIGERGEYDSFRGR